MITIQAFDYSPDSYAKLVAISNPIWPERPYTIADFEHEDKGKRPDGDKYAQRWIAELDGAAVGHAQVVQDWQRKDIKRYFMQIEVLPAYRQQGVGSTLFAQVLATLAGNAPFELVTDTMEDRSATVAWLERRGFVLDQREPMSALQVQPFDPTPFAGALQKSAEANIAIKSVAQLAESDPDYKHKLFDLIWEIINDVPGSHGDKREKPGYDYLEERIMGDPTFTPDAYFVAFEADSGDFVGLCNVHPKALPGHWNNGLTGVLRSHRRKGIATTLKLATIAHVKEAGGSEISTSNEENNPMYGINMMLGFEPRPAVVTYQRNIDEKEIDS